LACLKTRRNCGLKSSPRWQSLGLPRNCLMSS